MKKNLITSFQNFRRRVSFLPQSKLKPGLPSIILDKENQFCLQSTRIKTSQSTNVSYLQLQISLSDSDLSKSGRTGSQTEWFLKVDSIVVKRLKTEKKYVLHIAE